ncbi:hypothetical protein [Blautia obeum]|uniref:hypothetical protein n=1 Tax=Blautia obeum TaxID=40520 RepID=UPI001FBAF9E4|nr:hypothetical protein [Blautia obeum]
MRFNTKKYQELMVEQELTPEIICRTTGLGEKSFQWIMTNGFASEDAVERLAEAAGVQAGELLLPDISRTTENAIEFTKHSKRATVTFSQPRYINRIKKLAEKYPEECKIVSVDRIPDEGEILCAHIPTAWVRINPGKDLTEEQRNAIGKRLHSNS